MIYRVNESQAKIRIMSERAGGLTTCGIYDGDLQNVM